MSLTQVIKDEGLDKDNKPLLIWKSPIEDFNTGSQLIVHESQEAVFFMNGQALDLFGPGRYTLETQNMPLLSKFFNKATGGETPYHCEIYFVNKTEQMAIKWGTDSQVQYMEPEYKFPLNIGASGEMTLSVADSRKLLVKVVGTEDKFTQEDLVRKFKAFLMVKVKPYLAKTMQEAKFSIFEIDSHMGELSEELHKELIEDFKDYGLNLDRFFVTTIAKPDGDEAYEKFKELHLRNYSDVAEATLRQKVGIIDQETEKQKTIIEAEAAAEKRKIEGYTYEQERSYNIGEKLAENEGVGEFSNMGVGLGMMTGVAGTLGNTVGETIGKTVEPMKQDNEKEDDEMVAFKKKLDKLKIMKENGIITEEEYEQEKKKLLENL
ncbi:MAG: SPFH domain-containing protein [Clostridia bacterium]|nr:SPFH domain-containing protein [Clostridia bacterium]